MTDIDPEAISREALADPVGAVEIAARMQVKRATVDQWRQRDMGFPAPRWTVGGRPAWDWPDIQAWNRTRPPYAHAIKESTSAAVA